MNSRFEFRRRSIQLFFYLISVNGLLLVILFLSQATLQTGQVIIITGVVNIFYLATVVSKPVKIIIDQDNFLLEIHYLLKLLKNPKIIPLSGVECSFGDEMRSRGGKSKVLRIIYEKKLIVELLPDYSGWSKENLAQIFEKLNNVQKLN